MLLQRPRRRGAGGAACAVWALSAWEWHPWVAALEKSHPAEAGDQQNFSPQRGRCVECNATWFPGAQCEIPALPALFLLVGHGQSKGRLSREFRTEAGSFSHFEFSATAFIGGGLSLVEVVPLVATTEELFAADELRSPVVSASRGVSQKAKKTHFTSLQKLLSR